MRKRVIILFGAGLLVIAAGGAGLWAYLRPPDEEVFSKGGSMALKSGGQSAPEPAMIMSGGAPSPSAAPTSVNKGRSAEPTFKVEDGSAASPGSSPASTQPDDLTQYEKYRDSKDSLFAEIVLGSGAQVASGNTVTLHYRGWLTNGTKFDESYAAGKPFSFVVGQNTVIPGFQQGVAGMKVGGKRRLIIPPSQGYGTQAMGSIPANSLLIFDVELLEVK